MNLIARKVSKEGLVDGGVLYILHVYSDNSYILPSHCCSTHPDQLHHTIQSSDYAYHVLVSSPAPKHT